MELRRQILADLDVALAALRNITPAEEANGWDEPRAQNWRDVFGRLRDAVRDGRPLRMDYDGVVFSRGLDMDGVCSGNVFDAAVRIGRAVRELCRQEPDIRS